MLTRASSLSRGATSTSAPGPGVRGSERYFSRWSHVGLMFELYLWGVVPGHCETIDSDFRLQILRGASYHWRIKAILSSEWPSLRVLEEYTTTSHGRRRAPKSWRGSPRSLTRGNFTLRYCTMKSLHPASDPFYLVLSSESWAGTSSPPRLSPMPFNHQKACVAFLFNPLCLLP